MLRFALLATVAACGSSPPPAAPSPPAPDCASAVAAAGRFVVEPREAERVKSVVALRCVEDHWPASATSCIAGAANLEAAHACIRDTLTVAQHERLMSELTPPVAPVVDKPPEVPPVAVEEPRDPATRNQIVIAARAFAEGEKLFAKKQFAEASSRYRDAVSRVPEARYYLGLCRSLYAQGRFNEALTACAAGRRENPSAATRQDLEQTSNAIMSEAKAQGISLQQ